MFYSSLKMLLNEAIHIISRRSQKIKRQLLVVITSTELMTLKGSYTLFFFFIRILFFRPRLNIPIFLPILGWKYSCNILNYSLCIGGRAKSKVGRGAENKIGHSIFISPPPPPPPNPFIRCSFIFDMLTASLIWSRKKWFDRSLWRHCFAVYRKE